MVTCLFCTVTCMFCMITCRWQTQFVTSAVVNRKLTSHYLLASINMQGSEIHRESDCSAPPGLMELWTDTTDQHRIKNFDPPRELKSVDKSRTENADGES